MAAEQAAMLWCSAVMCVCRVRLAMVETAVNASESERAADEAAAKIGPLQRLIVCMAVGGSAGAKDATGAHQAAPTSLVRAGVQFTGVGGQASNQCQPHASPACADQWLASKHSYRPLADKVNTN
eukprot:GHRR01031714.1.p1 GENE.GHRR01031714.1~~GHRR01031714.1.p1  ORF type:complete len:125 (+),score=26.20 GHRR01031714.1:308-682(+)